MKRKPSKDVRACLDIIKEINKAGYGVMLFAHQAEKAPPKKKRRRAT